MANNDRVNEVYHAGSQTGLRERIHWICSQVQGTRVLDVGCSQGIVSILLAREGCDVLGLDIEPGAIAYAEKELEAEPQEVRSRVKFVCADASAFPLDPSTYDTVVLGEVLEHLVMPERVLAAAFRALNEKGRLVVTVPFGVLEHSDHKRTFYPSSLLSMLEPFAVVTGLTVVDKWLCCVAKKRLRPTVKADYDPDDVLRLTEAAVVRLETQLQGTATRLETKLRKATADLDGERKNVETAEQRALESEDRARALLTQIEPLRARSAQLEEQLRGAAAELTAERRSTEKSEQLLVERVEQVRTLDAAAIAERTKLESAERRSLQSEERSRALETQIDSLRARSAQVEEQLRRVAAELTAERKKVEDTEQRLLERDNQARALEVALAAEQERVESSEQVRLQREEDVRNLETQIDPLRAGSAHLEEQLRRGAAELAVERAKIENFEQLLLERDQQLRALAAELVTEREKGANSEQLLLERGDQVRVLESALAAMQEHVAKDSQVALQREEQLHILQAEVTAQRKRATEAEQHSFEREERVRSLEGQLEPMRARSAQVEEQLRRAAANLAAERKMTESAERVARQREERIRALDVEIARVKTMAAELEERTHASEQAARTQLDRVHSAEADVARLRSQIRIQDLSVARSQRTAEAVKNSARYRIGEAMVSALTPSKDTLLLPVRLTEILAEGVRRTRGRKNPQRSDVQSPPQKHPAANPTSERAIASGEANPPVLVSRSSVKPEAPSKSREVENSKPNTPAKSAPVAQSTSTANGPTELRFPRELASVPRSSSDLRVAAILDEISSACFAADRDLITFGPDNWRAVLDDRPPHLLLVESAWRGNRGAWQYRIGSYAHPDSMGLRDLRALTEWCQKRAIPTVFWNKEDPVHFDRFKEAATLFDVVFTTDSDSIPRYRKLPGLRGRVEALMFAAEPKLHNPAFSRLNRAMEPCFTGSFHEDRHAKSKQALEMLLDAALPLDLVIYDRDAAGPKDPSRFPERFRRHVRGGMPYEELVRSVYKEYSVFLNANSVADSPTMLSRRVFEILASGGTVVSTPSRAISEIFGSLVPQVGTCEEARGALTELTRNRGPRSPSIRDAVRLLMGKHTYRHRLEQIAAAAGYVLAGDNRLEVTAVVMAREQSGLRRALSAIPTQGYRPKEVVVCAPLEERRMAEETLRRVAVSLPARVVTTEGRDESALYRRGAGVATTGWVWPVSDSFAYGPSFLSDLIAASQMAPAEIVTTQKNGEAADYAYVECVHPAASIVRTPVVARFGWSDQLEWHHRIGWGSLGTRTFSLLSVDQ